VATTRRRPAGQLQADRDAAVLSERWYWLITPFVNRIVAKLEAVEHAEPGAGLTPAELVRVLALVATVEETVGTIADIIARPVPASRET
jgi:hypothetical protein